MELELEIEIIQKGAKEKYKIFSSPTPVLFSRENYF